MELSYHQTVEEIRDQAERVIASIPALEQILAIDMPGRFVYSPPNGSRISVSSLEELHEVRTVLRDRFGWKDYLDNKFCSGRDVIVTYKPTDDVILPLPFQLWVDAPAEYFPKELLGDCKLIKIESDEYTVVCPVG